MADVDVIARLYPFGDIDNDYEGIELANEVVKKLNPSRYAGTARSTLLVDDVERGPTERPHLELRFSHGPRTNLGFVLGKDPATCDIVLADIQGISDQHCAITFENDFNDTDNYRLVVRDLETTCGTSVSYGGQAGRHHGGIRSGFRWIVGGHSVPQAKTIVIQLHRLLQFRIVVPVHDIESQLYRDSVARFHQGATSVEDLFFQLGIPSRPRTEPPSGARTPGKGPIELKEKLGQGSFGVVTHVWDVSDGDEHALKEPSRKAIRENRVDRDAWTREANIMGRISHNHIVRLLGAMFTQVPRLIFEYVPGGALEGYDDISTAEGVQVLEQCLSALDYLHGHDPPIVHRDIKPDNILVHYRRANDIYVKLGDFGLSKECRDPKTFCGTPLYLAPELYSTRGRRSYTQVVDVWSLGVTVFGCVYDLPPGNSEGTSWCEAVIKKLGKQLDRYPDDLTQFLWDNMVVMSPELRQSAHYCYEQILLLTNQHRSVTPTPASYAYQSYQDGQASGYPSLGGSGTQQARADIYPQPEGDYSTMNGHYNDQTTVLPQEGSRSGSGSGPGSGFSQRPPLNNPNTNYDGFDPAEIPGQDGPGGVPSRSQPSAAGFHDSWLQDPLHAFGGGSTLAAELGQEPSVWASQGEEPPRYHDLPDNEALDPLPGVRKRRTRRLASSSSSQRHGKRRARHSESGAPSEAARHGGVSHAGNGVSMLPEEPEWADMDGSNAGQVDGFYPLYDDATPRGDSPVVAYPQGWPDEPQEEPWTESEAQIADALFRALHPDC